MALRAVVFDYGKVLTGLPDARAFEAMLRITGLDASRLNELYWAGRRAYDEGQLTGLEFWRNLATQARLGLNSEAIDELNDWDARMWTTVNPAMLAWRRQVKQRGLLTAILSNMGDNVHARMVREFEWLSEFDALVWSYRLGVAKPDPAIYRHLLTQLDLRPEETLFLDDKTANIDAARELGMKAFVFTTVEQLRADLVAAGFDDALPLPE